MYWRISLVSRLHFHCPVWTRKRGPGEGQANDVTLRWRALSRLFSTSVVTDAFVHCLNNSRFHVTLLPPCWRTITKDSSLASIVSSSNMAATSLSFDSLGIDCKPSINTKNNFKSYVSRYRGYMGLHVESVRIHGEYSNFLQRTEQYFNKFHTSQHYNSNIFLRSNGFASVRPLTSKWRL